MNEGVQALAKSRTYTYMLFGFDVLLLFHAGIANLFHTNDSKILYGLIALIVLQATIGSMYIVRYASEAENIIGAMYGGKKGKNKKYKSNKESVQKEKDLKHAMMYAARARYIMLGHYVVVLLLLLNHLQIHSYLLDKVVVVTAFVLIYFILKYVTILQRGRFE